jgi:hypothetical protein
VLVALAATAATAAIAYYAVSAFVSLYTRALWLHSVHDSDVFSRRLLTQVVLFLIFGGITAVVVGVNLALVVRHRPRDFAPDPAKQRWRFLFGRDVHRWRRWIAILVTAYATITVGSMAAGSWQTWLQWRNSTSFHRTDPQFHRDVSYFLFVYPMHRLVVTLAFRIVLTTLILVLVTAYLYGGARLRGTGARMSRAVVAQTSGLVGVYLLLKAVAYWLDRFGTAMSGHGVVTGSSYTDVHALLPDKLILLVIAALLGLGLLANMLLTRSGRLLAIGIGVMAAAALVFGVVVPALVQQFKDKPSASSLEIPYIARNITATRSAFGLAGTVTSKSFSPTSTDPQVLRLQADQDAQVRLLDPNQFSSTFTQDQQLRSFYNFKSTLDVDRYLVSGKDQDVLVAVRELQQSGLNNSQLTWTNTHLVYTHGYGVVAAPTDVTDRSGSPTYVEKDAPPSGSLGSFVPQIYYGQMSPSYSIVGAAAGSQPKEYDHPADVGSGQVDNTYTGGGGISLGSEFRRLVYAVKLHSASILFSNEINSHSQLLTVRNPRSRVASVAPWLTLDGDTYPVVSGGRVLWVVDGYTTSSGYPDSQQQNLKSATTNTLTQSGSTVTQPSSSVNYIRNSVKATVDAYTGAVTLYEWNQGATRDPVLATWEKAFPGLVKPQAAMPADLVQHLRYPQDLFNLQRSVLTQYHVTNAHQFYNGSDFWKVPNDPTVSSTSTTNSIGKKVSVSAPSQPSTYMSMSPDGGAAATFALSSPLVTLNKRSLASLLTVDSQPGPGYGHFTLLNVPSTGSPGLSQVQNDIESDPKVTQLLTLLRGGKSKVVLGNLLTIPLGNRMLYVEPVYTQSTGSNSFPTLQKVAAVYGNGPTAFASTLGQALDTAIGARPQGVPKSTP